VRYLGVTGHADPDVLIAAIERFPFDTVLMALNAADKHQLSFSEKLLPLAMEKQMGIIGMKIPARSRILASWTPPPPGQQPAFGQATRPGTLTMKEALYYVLSQPVSTVIIGCDTIAHVEENVRLAAEFTPLTDTSLGVLAEKTESIARQALFFRRWG
jgi:predicted aldo/keto reductase-like oxidoreductase